MVFLAVAQLDAFRTAVLALGPRRWNWELQMNRDSPLNGT